MGDSGQTVISHTVFASQPAADMDDSEEVTLMRDHDGAGELSAEELGAAANADMDFDLTGSDSANELSDLYEPDPDEADTIIREVPSVDESVEEPEFKLDEEMDDADSGDETIMLDDGDEEELVSDPDEDVTLRKDE